MGKKVIDEGAPAYMAQYTALMTILLAFFILLNTLTQEQDAGFKAGIGDVKNAFGINGGLGLFQFSYVGNGAANPVATKRKNRTDNKEIGFEKKLLTSGGGAGNTDVDFDKDTMGEYLRLKIGYDFSYPHDADRIPDDMRDYLTKIGMGIQMFNYNISIRCYSMENEDMEKRFVLAYKRAVRIMNFLHRYCHIDYGRMLASGTGTDNYFQNVIENRSKKAEKNEGESPDAREKVDLSETNVKETADVQNSGDQKKDGGGRKSEPLGEKTETEERKDFEGKQGTFFYVFFKNTSKNVKTQ